MEKKYPVVAFKKKVINSFTCLLVFLSLFSYTSVKAQCFYVESILVDACNGAPCPGTAQEGENEMVLIKVGGTALTIAYGTTTAAKLTPTWPNNSFQGWQAPGTLTNPLVSALNATIIKCGYLKQPVGGVLPANSQVLIITSTDMCTSGNSFANLTDTLYVIFQIAGNTAGHFANNDNTGTVTSTPTGSVSTRTMTMAYTGTPSCSESVTYDRSLLVNDLGTYGGSSAQNDGSTVQYNSAGVATYVNNGCQAPYIPMDVAASAPASICSNAHPTITGTVSGPATTYSWTTNGTGTLSVGTGSLSGTGSTTVNTVYTPSGGESGTITFTLTAHGKCSLAVVTNTVAIAINPAPSPTITSSNGASICAGGSTVLTASGSGTSFTWNPGAHSGTTYTVSPASTQIYTVAVTNTCGTTDANFTVTVAPAPTYSLAGNSYTICNGSSQTFTVSGANTYTWTPAATLTGANTANPVASPTATTVYSVTGTSAGGCVNATPATVTVTVNPKPTLALTGNSYTICNGNSQTFTVSGASTYTWTPAATLTGANTANPVASPTSTTVYSVTGTSAGGCVNATPATVTVTVNPKPTLTLTGNSYMICNGGSQTFTVSGGNTYTWTPSATLTNANSANPTASPTTTTVYSVTGANIAGCVTATPATVTVTVNAVPALSLASNSYTICNGSSQTFTASGASSYTWTPAATLTGANTANPTADPSTTTVYTVSGTANGCSPSSPLTLTLTVNPLPVYSLTANSYTICNGNSQGLSVSGASTYTWTPATTLSGANTANPTASPTSTTVYSVTGTSAAGCTNATPATVSVTVNPKPTYSLTGNAYTICSGGSQTFTVSGASTYTWTPATTLTNANIANPTASPTTTTVYSVTGTSVAGCVNLIPATVTVTVSPIPALSLASNSYTICNGATKTFTVSGASTYTWTPAATLTGANTANPTASPATTTIYTVAGTASGCAPSSPLTLTLTVNPLPTYSLAANSYTICNGSSQALSVSGAGTYTWTPSSTLTGANTASPSANPTTTTVYSVTGTNANACTNLIPATVTVNVNPLPTYTLAANSYTICNGASQALSVSGASTYAWAPAATLTGANTANPIANPTTTTVYSVTGTNASACTNLIPATVTVNVNPLPTYSLASNSYTICLGSSQTFSVSGASTYTWTPAINLTGINTNNPTANPTTTTIYSVTGTNASTCTNLIPATVTLTINPLPDLSTVASSTAICSGGGSSILTASGAGPTGTYTWTPSATLSSPTGSTVTATPTNTTSPTVYTVTGTDANGCSNKTTVSITVNQTPTVTISGGGGNAQTICGGGLVNTTVAGITFVSTPAGSISWTNSNINLGGPLSSASGTGNIASYPAPTVTAQTVGTVTATAIASGSGCPSISATQLIYTITINPIPGAATPTITPASCGVNDGTIIGADGTGGSTYQYSWDGGATFSSVSSYTNGAGTYPLEIKDVATGCIFSKNFTLPNAGAPPPPAVTVSSSSVCIGGTATLTVNAPVAGTTYSWTPAAGTPGTGNTFTVTIPNGALTPFTIDVTSTASNCTGVAGTTSITVNQLPTPSISNSTAQICDLTSTTLTVTPNTGGYSYQWGNASGAIAGAIKDTLTVSAAGVYSVTVTNTVTGCQATTSNNGTITVNSLPVISTASISVTPSNCTSPTGAITNVTYTVNGTGTYVWTDNSTGNVVGGNTPTLSNVPAGNYCVQVTDANSCVQKYCSIPVVNAGAPAQPILTASLQDTVYCNGTGPNTLTVTVTNSGTVTPTVNWYDASNTILASNTNTYTPTSLPVGTTTLYVTATANGCSSTEKPVTITVNALPTYTLTGTNYTICNGGSQTFTISGTGSNTYTWSPAGTLTGVNTANPTASPTATTIYSVTGTDANGCSNNTPATVLVNVTASPNLTLSSDSYSICTGNSQTLSASGVSTYTWVPATNLTGANTASPVANPTTTTVYTVTGTSNGCAPSAPLTLTLTVNSLPTYSLAANAYAVCAGNSQGLSVSGANTYTWTPATGLSNANAANPTANPAATTIYSVTGTDANGCTNLIPSTVTLTVNSLPILNLVADSYTICSGSSQTFTVSGASTYTWTPASDLTGVNAASPTVNPTTSTVYSVTGTNLNGCSNLTPSSVTLTVNQPPVLVLSANSYFICSGNTQTFSVSGASSYTWAPASTLTGANTANPSSNASVTTVYTVSGTNNGCLSSSPQTVTLTVNSNPTLDISNQVLDTANCGHLTGGVTGIAVVGGTPNFSYQWYDSNGAVAGANSLTLSNVASGLYTLQVTDANGCTTNLASSAASFSVPASAAVHAQFNMNPSPATGDVPLAVTFTNTSTGALNYIWAFGDQATTFTTSVNANFTYTAAGSYTATLVAINGSCTDTARIVILAETPTIIVIPNIFSPNGDGINDGFFIKNTGLISLNCDIYNRWGQLLHTLTAPDQIWDGVTPNGDKAPEGTYMYIFQATGIDGKDYKQQGTLTLTR